MTVSAERLPNTPHGWRSPGTPYFAAYRDHAAGHRDPLAAGRMEHESCCPGWSAGSFEGDAGPPFRHPDRRRPPGSNEPAVVPPSTVAPVAGPTVDRLAVA